MSAPRSDYRRWMTRPDVTMVCTMGRTTGVIVSTLGPSVRRNVQHAAKAITATSGPIQCQWRFRDAIRSHVSQSGAVAQCNRADEGPLMLENPVDDGAARRGQGGGWRMMYTPTSSPQISQRVESRLRLGPNE